MLKKCLLSIALLLSTMILADQDWRSDALSAGDLAVVDNASEMYCYLNPEFVEAMRSLPGNVPAVVRELRAHMQSHSVVTVELARRAVDAAMQYCSSNPAVSRLQLEAIEDYKQALESGDAVFTPETATRGSKCKKFCKLLVKKCLRAGSLNVCGNVQIGGDLCVTGSINGLPIVDGDFTFNCGGLSPVGSSCESLLNNIRGRFCPDNTVSVDTTYGVAITSTTYPVSDLIPEDCFTVTPVAFVFPDDLTNPDGITIPEGAQIVVSYRVDFNGTPFASRPSVVITLETAQPYLPFNVSILVENLIANVSNVDETGFNVNLVIFPEDETGVSESELAAAINAILSSTCVHFIAQGPQGAGVCDSTCPADVSC